MPERLQEVGGRVTPGAVTEEIHLKYSEPLIHNRPLLMYNHLMPTSLETQEIMVAFAIDNKDNLDSWGKYILEELQDAYADMPEDDRASTAGQRIINRIEELENVVEKDEVKDDRQNEKPKQRSHDNKKRKQVIIGGIIVGFIILLLAIYFFV
jgi:hypothetical protein